MTDIYLNNSIALWVLMVFGPVLFGLIFLLFRLTLRYGHSIIGLRTPLVTLVLSAAWLVFMFSIGSLGGWVIYVNVSLFALVIIAWIVDSRITKKTLGKKPDSETPTRQIIKTVSGIGFATIFLVISVCVFMAIPDIKASLSLDRSDGPKYTNLDKSISLLYDKLVSASNGMDKWKIYKTCSPEYESGSPFPNGYNCKIRISTYRNKFTTQQVLSLHEQYFPVIKSFGNITMEGKAEAPPTEANDQFSQSFIENGTGFTCNYDIGKGYLFDNTTVALVSFSCNGKETKIAWYPVVK